MFIIFSRLGLAGGSANSLQSANPHQEMDMPNIQRQSSAQPSLQPGPTGTGSLAKPDGYSCPQPDTPVRDGGGRVSAREV